MQYRPACIESCTSSRVASNADIVPYLQPDVIISLARGQDPKIELNPRSFVKGSLSDDPVWDDYVLMLTRNISKKCPFFFILLILYHFIH